MTITLSDAVLLLVSKEEPVCRKGYAILTEHLRKFNLTWRDLSDRLPSDAGRVAVSMALMDRDNVNEAIIALRYVNRNVNAERWTEMLMHFMNQAKTRTNARTDSHSAAATEAARRARAAAEAQRAYEEELAERRRAKRARERERARAKAKASQSDETAQREREMREGIARLIKEEHEARKVLDTIARRLAMAKNELEGIQVKAQKAAKAAASEREAQARAASRAAGPHYSARQASDLYHAYATLRDARHQAERDAAREPYHVRYPRPEGPGPGKCADRFGAAMHFVRGKVVVDMTREEMGTTKAWFRITLHGEAIGRFTTTDAEFVAMVAHFQCVNKPVTVMSRVSGAGEHVVGADEHMVAEFIGPWAR